MLSCTINYRMMKLIIILCVIVFSSSEENTFEKSLVLMIQDAGHTVEVHKVLTEDNYILSVFRLPSKMENPKIAYMMHGIESSAADYVIGGNGASLAYLLADNGYDVWLGNARGNVFSQAHKTLDKKSTDFWDFSFHEIGVYDVAAIIDYVLDKFNRTSLTYIGYSQGTSVLFVLLSMRPEYNSKISTAYLLAPVAFLRYPVFFSKPISSLVNQILDYVNATRNYEWFPLNPETRRSVAYYCKSFLGSSTCKQNYVMIGGDSINQYNEELIPKIYQFFPASIGYRQAIHYAQIVNANGRFLQYDHGREKNLEIYKQPVPPPYPISKVNTQLHFIYGANDAMANPKDVQYLMARLKTSMIGSTKINNWNHLDFLFGKSVQRKVNNVILYKMKSRD